MDNFERRNGRSALYDLLGREAVDADFYKYVVEPEVVERGSIEFSISFSDFKTLYYNNLEKLKKFERLRPPPSIKFLINKDFLLSGLDISKNEFMILTMISDYSSAGEVYKRSSLPDYLVTECLVTLRSKNALRVC